MDKYAIVVCFAPISDPVAHDPYVAFLGTPDDADEYIKANAHPMSGFVKYELDMGKNTTVLSDVSKWARLRERNKTTGVTYMTTKCEV